MHPASSRWHAISVQDEQQIPSRGCHITIRRCRNLDISGGSPRYGTPDTALILIKCVCDCTRTQKNHFRNRNRQGGLYSKPRSVGDCRGCVRDGRPRLKEVVGTISFVGRCPTVRIASHDQTSVW